MPPWTRNRADKSKEKASEKELRRQTFIENGQQVTPPHDAEAAAGPSALTQVPSRRNRRLRDSVVSLSAVNETPAGQDGAYSHLRVPEPSERSTKSNPFSLMKSRHASDPQLSRTAKEHAEHTPPVPKLSPPSIITTAPTQEVLGSSKRKSAFFLPRRNKSPTPSQRRQQAIEGNVDLESSPVVTFHEPSFSRPTASNVGPPPYGDEANSALALPVSRISDSSRSDGSSGDHGVYATTTTTHIVSTTTTFFRLPRRKTGKGPLFPLPPKGGSSNALAGETPRLLTGQNSHSPTKPYFPPHPEQGSTSGSPRRHLTFGIERSQSRASTRSGRPSSVIPRGSTAEQRGRSSTINSHRRGVEDDSIPTPPLPLSTRTSTSTAGRPSLAGIFNLSRLRQSSEPMFGRNQFGAGGPDTPRSIDSKQTSFNLPRDPPIALPCREEGDTPARYLARLEEVVNRGALVALISKSNDDFMKNVLRSFMRRFSFFEEPLDMAIRKLLTQVQLPKETQQIDRTVQSFADRYHECNPGIFGSSDDAYFVAFSIIILHTDFFNSNNKHKMQRHDYVKNSTRKEPSQESREAKAELNDEPSGVTPEILECFYDNIVYTPFIHLEDEVELTSERIIAHKASSRNVLKPSSAHSVKKSNSGPIDPYLLIFDGRLDVLRPPLEDILSLDDPFSYLGTASSIDVSELNRCFFKYGVIQILSSRSRPGAFMNQATISNPAESHVGIVDMKVTKIGILWRKAPKKKKTRSPWQEWGVILTGSQLYFFRNTTWIKNLVNQFEAHRKGGKTNTPLVFKPPLEQLKPEFLLSTDQVIALRDSEYRKHKYAFFIMRQTAYQEVFLADDEPDMNDWLAKINYAATFRTAGVRMRGILSGFTESTVPLEGRKIESRSSARSNLTSTNILLGHTTNADEELTRQIMQARRQIMLQKTYESRGRISEFEKILEHLLRTARHLCVLTPIQARTREELTAAALRLATNIRWARIEKWRVQAHSNILQLDLDEDSKPTSNSIAVSSNKNESTPLRSKEKDSKLPFARFNSKGASTAAPSSSRSRPSNQPTGAKLFSMDDIFRSPSRTRQQPHKAKGSWEIPPLSFERGRSVSLSRYSKTSSRRSSDQPTEQSFSPLRADTVYSKPEISRASSSVAGSTDIKDEHDVLVEAGIVSPESQNSKGDKGAPNDSEDKAKIPELEEKEGLSKVRHSLHRKLQNAHVPVHHRSRKARDSSASAAISEDSTSTAEGEVLARASGSFTVQGKKASIVTFGSEWQNFALEDRRVRRSTHEDDTSLHHPSSSASRSSTVEAPSTIRSLGFVTPSGGVSAESPPVSPRMQAQSPASDEKELLDDEPELQEEAFGA